MFCYMPQHLVYTDICNVGWCIELHTNNKFIQKEQINKQKKNKTHTQKENHIRREKSVKRKIQQ